MSDLKRSNLKLEKPKFWIVLLIVVMLLGMASPALSQEVAAPTNLVGEQVAQGMIKGYVERIDGLWSTQPVSGVSVKVTGAGQGFAVTASDGSFSIGNLPMGTYTLTIPAGHSDGADYTHPYPITITSTYSPNTVIQIQPGVINGIVKGSSSFGQPLSGVSVNAYSYSGQTDSISGSPVTAVTDANGSFSIRNLPFGSYKLRIPAHLTYPANSYPWYTSILLTADIPTQNVPVPLAAKRALVGRVTDDNNMGLANIYVIAKSEGAPYSSYSAQTDQDGLYFMGSMNVGKYKVYFNPLEQKNPHYSSYTLPYYEPVTDWQAGPNISAKLKLEQPFQSSGINGRVTDSSGKGLATIQVTAINSSGSMVATTDALGNYKFGELSPGIYKVICEPGEHNEQNGTTFQLQIKDGVVVTQGLVTPNINVIMTMSPDNGSVVPPQNYTFQLSTSGQGTLSLANSTTHAPGTKVSVTATATTGWKFKQWLGDATGTTNPLEITMDSNKTVSAVFEAVPSKGTTGDDWALQNTVLRNQPEAALIVRTGDIDNLNFGWPPGFNPFSGNATPSHDFPWEVNAADAPGTDRIMVITSYNDKPPSGFDGYTSSTNRPANAVTPIVLQYDLQGLAVSTARLQIFVDDFQAPLWGANYQVSINGKRAVFLEEVINSLEQTGPVGKLITVQVPDGFLSDVAGGSLSLVFDDKTTGAGEGYAIDFVRLLVNPVSGGDTHTGVITGTVTDASSDLPLANVKVSAGSGLATAVTDSNGQFTLNGVPAGLVSLQVSLNGYAIAKQSLDLQASQTVAAEIALTPTPQNYSLRMTVSGEGVLSLPSDTSYAPGSQVTLEAIPAKGWIFKQWTGEAGGTTNPLTLTMDQNKALTAVFEQSPVNQPVNPVSPDKVWTITFNMPLKDDLNMIKEHIQVRNSLDNTVDALITYGPTKSQIVIHPPSPLGTYVKNETYKLVIKSGLQSQSGALLAKDVMKYFRAE